MTAVWSRRIETGSDAGMSDLTASLELPWLDIETAKAVRRGDLGRLMRLLATEDMGVDFRDRVSDCLDRVGRVSV